MPLVEADGQVCARADEANRPKSTLVECCRALAESLDVVAPRGDGVGLVQAGGRDHSVPEALDVGLAEDGGRPPLVGVADDRPLDEPSVLRVEQLLRGQSRARPLGAALVEIGEELGLGVSGDGDRRSAGVDHVVEERERPWRRPPERIVGCVLNTRAPEVHVAVMGLDVSSPSLVGDPADRADER